jgi:iron(III) transport system permease protein
MIAAPQPIHFARSRLRAAVPGLAMVVLIALLVVPAIWTLVHTSLFDSQTGLDSGRFTLRHYAALVSGDRLPRMLLNSILFALGATTLSLLVGGSLAWLVERTDTPFKALAYLTTVISLGTPYILYVTAWLFLLGRSGPLNDLYRFTVDPMATLFNVNSLAGMMLIEGLLWSPLVFLMLAATFRAANAEMEEAARMSGASVFETIRLVSLRLAAPAILGLAMFVFIRNLEAFDVPALVGMPGRVDILTTEIYRAIISMPPQLGYASAFSVALLAMVAVLLYFYSRISRHAERYASITGKGYRPRPFRLGGLRWLGGTIILVNFLIVLVLPVLAILWMALMPFVRPMRWSSLKLLTVRNFQTVFGSPYYLDLAINTVVVAFTAASVVMLMTGIAGWLAARRWRFGQAVDQLITVPLVFPGLVLGVALLEVALRLPLPVYGTLWLISFACIVRYMPYGMRYVYSGVLQIHRELEQAAGVAGAGIWQTLRRVVGPLLWPALSSGWVFVFLITAKELAMPLVLAGPHSQTIAVAMFDLWSNGQIGEGAALGLLWTTAMTAVAAMLHRAMRKRSIGTFGA